MKIPFYKKYLTTIRPELLKRCKANFSILSSLIFLTTWNPILFAQTNDILLIGNSYSFGTAPFLNGFVTNHNFTDCDPWTVTAYTPGGRTIKGHSQNSFVMDTLLTSGNYEHIVLQEQSYQHRFEWADATRYSQYVESPPVTNFFNDGSYEVVTISPWEPVTPAQYILGTIPETNLETYEYYEADGTPSFTSYKYVFAGGGTTYTIHNTDGTTESYTNDSYSASYSAIIDKALESNPNAEFNLYQTWGRSPDLFSEESHDEHLEANIEVNKILADHFNEQGVTIDIGPVGEAFKAARDLYGINLYSGDGSHANGLGYYLSAAVLYEQIVGSECPCANLEHNLYNPHGAVGDLLRELAFSIVNPTAGDSTINSAFDTIGNMYMGGGNDTLNLTAGTYLGNIYGDYDENCEHMNLIGDDAFNWSGGKLIGGYFGGYGSDVANIYEGSEYDGTQLLDGGDDVSTADGWVDTLTVQGEIVSTPGTNIINWENVIIDGGSMTFSDNQLVTGSDTGTGLTITNGGLVNGGINFTLTGNLTTSFAGTLFTTGASTVSGSATNNGIISMQDGNAGDTLTIGGNYEGSGSLLLDTSFDSASSDKLIIGGDVTGGPTQIFISGNPAGYQEGSTITLAEVTGATSEGDFSLGNSTLTYGPFDYELGLELLGANWMLNTVAVSINSTGATYELAPKALLGFAELPTLRQRIHDRYVFGKKNNTSASEDKKGNFWLTHKHERLESVTSNNTDFERKLGELYFGSDFEAEITYEGQWIFGIVGHYQYQTTDISIERGSGSIDTTGYGVTATATWYGANKLYVDTQAKYTIIESDMRSSQGGELTSGHDSNAVAMSIEMGQQFQLKNHKLIPQVQLMWGSARGGEFTDELGNAVSLETNDQLIARLGATYEFNITGTATSGKGFYIIGNILHNLSAENTINVADIEIISETQETWAELGLGASMNLGKQFNLHGEFSYRTSLSEFSKNSALRLDLGTKIYW